MLKDTAADVLLNCLRQVAAGLRWLPEELVSAAMTRDIGREVEIRRTTDALTAREREVSELVAQGLSNKHIARQLDVSEGTVKIHLHNIYRKLGVMNRTTLAALALRLWVRS
jgi:DNA-binding NarL/FixJ family response regulator